MRARYTLLTLGFAALLLSVVARVAYAVPPLPSSFYGTVKIDGANVPAGTLVSAWINGEKYAETAVMIFGGDTVYSMDIPGDDLTTLGIIEGGRQGETILFYIGSSPANQTGHWQSGTNVQLNLSRPAAPVPASITVEVAPAALIVNNGATAVVTATVRDGANQPIAGVMLSGSTSPPTLGTASLPSPTNASGQTFGTWTAGSVVGSGLLRASSGSLTGTTSISLNNPLPTLTSVSPTTVTLNGASFTLTVTGTNFVNSSAIRWNGTLRATVYVSGTQLQSFIDSTQLVMTGTIDVTVLNPEPGGGVSNPLNVMIVKPKEYIYLPLITRSAAPSYMTSGAEALNWMYSILAKLF